MKIAVVQTHPIEGDVSGNLLRAEALINAHLGADVYLLPEMFSTGFCVNPVAVAEPPAGGTLQWMRQRAREMDAAVCGSVATAVELFTFVNRMFFVKPDGTVEHYDKRHLFSYAGEDKQYAAGTERVIVPFRGARFLLEICYDLRFPVWSRCRNDYDAALYAASWPVKRRNAWDVLLQARALENQCFVAAANRVGKDGNGGEYDGGSVILNPYGVPVAAVRDGEEGVAVAEIDLDAQKAFREKFPSMADGDEFQISSEQKISL